MYYSKDSALLSQKNSDIKYSENNVNIQHIRTETAKLRTKSCDMKRKFVSKINIEKNRLALQDAMNINKEVIKFDFLYFFIVKR